MKILLVLLIAGTAMVCLDMESTAACDDQPLATNNERKDDLPSATLQERVQAVKDQEIAVQATMEDTIAKRAEMMDLLERSPDVTTDDTFIDSLNMATLATIRAKASASHKAQVKKLEEDRKKLKEDRKKLQKYLQKHLQKLERKVVPGTRAHVPSCNSTLGRCSKTTNSCRLRPMWPTGRWH